MLFDHVKQAEGQRDALNEQSPLVYDTYWNEPARIHT